jgi:hypothetical protein
MNIDVYALYRQPYFDTKQQTYRNAITIDMKPNGPLGAIVKQIKISPTAQPGCYPDCQPICAYALLSLKSPCRLMTIEELPQLFGFLMSNGYKVDTSITKMLNNSDIRMQPGNNLIAFITKN